MDKTKRSFVVLFVAIVTLGVLSSVTQASASEVELSPMPLVSRSSCAGDGCTYVSATRLGDQVTLRAYGYSYTPGKYVWVQINVYNAKTSTLLWRNQARYTVRSDGRTGTMIAFVDCGVIVRATAWTWRAYSSTQPAATVSI